MAKEIKPTRSALIALKKKIKLASNGYNLLKRKKDGLISEFFKLLQDAKSIRKEMTESYQKAVGKLEVARAMDGTTGMESVATSITNIPEIQVDGRNVMGVKVPIIEAELVNMGGLER